MTDLLIEAEVGEPTFLYLIQGTPRAQLAAALLEYRAFAERRPDEPLAEDLLRVSRRVRIALKETRRILRATGGTGKVNERIAPRPS